MGIYAFQFLLSPFLHGLVSGVAVVAAVAFVLVVLDALIGGVAQLFESHDDALSGTAVARTAGAGRGGRGPVSPGLRLPIEPALAGPRGRIFQ